MAKYYAVKKGLVPGVYNSWDECKKNVDGFPGAEYKSFSSVSEAENYISGKQSDNDAQLLADALPEGHAIAYVDGSYNDKTGVSGYGIVFMTNNGKNQGSGFLKDAFGSRNVTGELKGAMIAIKWALELDIKTLHLYYDYEGIEKWATRKWDAKSTVAQKYASYVHLCGINIEFHKVKAHTGNKYNEIVDGLAKEAVGI